MANHGELHGHRHLGVNSQSSNLVMRRLWEHLSVGASPCHLDISRACAGVSPVGLGSVAAVGTLPDAALAALVAS